MRHTRIIVTQYGGPDALRVVEEECPEPKNGEVRVRVLAAGVSLPDIMAREGVHPETPPVPFTPGWDLVGVVERLGDGVSGIGPGQIVAALPIHGAYADSSACRKVNWFRCHPDWTPPRLSVSC
jgi:NADPH2:quinone reductase